jgi:hypothetical protein
MRSCRYVHQTERRMAEHLGEATQRDVARRS